MSLSIMRPEPRPILLNDPIDKERPLKLLLPPLKFRDLWVLLSLELVILLSPSSMVFVLATTNREMLLRQKGHVSEGMHKVAGLGLLWQHRANVQRAHIWCPQPWTSMVQTWLKQMKQRSVSLACKIFSAWIKIKEQTPTIRTNDSWDYHQETIKELFKKVSRKN